jgi:hypothetical protein
MNHQQLLLAAEVIKICDEMQQRARKNHIDEIENREDREQLLAAWDQQHPMSSYAPDAYKFLKKIATMIESLDTEPT